MSSPFVALDGVISSAIEGAFGECVRLLPQRVGKYSAGGADPDRPVREFIGLVTEDHGVQRSDGDAIGANFGFEMVAGSIRISLPVSAFPSPADYPVAGDRIQAIGRQGMPIFEVIRPAPDNASRIVLHCTKVKSP